MFEYLSYNNSVTVNSQQSTVNSRIIISFGVAKFFIKIIIYYFKFQIIGHLFISYYIIIVNFMNNLITRDICIPFYKCDDFLFNRKSKNKKMLEASLWRRRKQ